MIFEYILIQTHAVVISVKEIMARDAARFLVWIDGQGPQPNDISQRAIIKDPPPSSHVLALTAVCKEMRKDAGFIFWTENSFIFETGITHIPRCDSHREVCYGGRSLSTDEHVIHRAYGEPHHHHLEHFREIHDLGRFGDFKYKTWIEIFEGFLKQIGPECRAILTSSFPIRFAVGRVHLQISARTLKPLWEEFDSIPSLFDPEAKVKCVAGIEICWAEERSSTFGSHPIDLPLPLSSQEMRTIANTTIDSRRKQLAAHRLARLISLEEYGHSSHYLHKARLVVPPVLPEFIASLQLWEAEKTQRPKPKRGARRSARLIEQA